MSEIVVLCCVTTTEGGQAESRVAVPRETWAALPEDMREMEYSEIRAKHAHYLRTERGVTVDPGSLVVTVHERRLPERPAGSEEPTA